MLHSVKALQRFSIAATDGALGHVKDAYFDDREWTLRYLAVDTGGWLSGRKVLISPRSVDMVDWPNQALRVRLTREQVENSPGIDTEKPVARQHEEEFNNYYGYPYYWTGPFIWGYTAVPGALTPMPGQAGNDAETQRRIEQERANENPHLRSSDEVIGYDIQATDDAIGHVEDFLFDDESWKIELMVVDTRNWWPGKHVLVAPERIERVSWEGKIVVVDVTRDQVEHSPEYDSLRPPQGAGRHDLYRHFAWPPAW